MKGSMLMASALFLTASVAAEPLPLWPGVARGSENVPQPEFVATDANGNRAVSHIAKPSLTPFYANHPNGTAIVVSPGGGLKAEMFDHEGTAVARWLNTFGVDAYVLKYRLPDEGHAKGEDVALADIQRAIRLVRSQQSYRRVGTMGFSAGGHLTALSAVYWRAHVYEPVDAADALSARPDFFAVGYGFIPRPTDPELARFPADNPTYKYLLKYPFEPAVAGDTPPGFVMHGDADTHVSDEHGKRIFEALSKAGVACEFHVIKGADHGFALTGSGEAQKWPALFAAWLKGLDRQT